jgi:hypothetical protein
MIVTLSGSQFDQRGKKFAIQGLANRCAGPPPLT